MSVATLTAGAAAAQADPAPISSKLADPRLTSGEDAVVTGVASASFAGQPAALEFRADSPDGESWRVIGTRHIRPDGRFRLRGEVARSGSVRVRIANAPGEPQILGSARRVRILPRLLVSRRSLQVTVGRRAAVAGTVRPRAAGLVVVLQIFTGRRWATLDQTRTRSGGRYALADRRLNTMSARARVRVSGRSAGVGSSSRGLGRLDVYRRAHASWYGPGLYGNRLGCGGRLSAGSLGVAHKKLPCGTLVTFRRSGRSIRVPVIDRGPYVGGREYDLTAATARRLGFSGHGPILATR